MAAVSCHVTGRIGRMGDAKVGLMTYLILEDALAWANNYGIGDDVALFDGYR